MTIQGSCHALVLRSIWFEFGDSCPLAILLVVIQEEMELCINSGKQTVVLVEKLPHLADTFKDVWKQSLPTEWIIFLMFLTN